MSSSTYSSCLKPDPWLRLFVDVSAQLLTAAGIAVSLTMSLDALPRLGLALACLALGRFELQRLRRGQKACTEIRLMDDGSASILDGLDTWVTASLESGSIVLNELAWLRFRTSDGVMVTELLAGDARRCPDWRRLQVIWRHIGADSGSC